MFYKCQLIVEPPGYNDLMRFIEDNTNCYLDELESTSVQDLKIFTNRNPHRPAIECKDYSFLQNSKMSFDFVLDYTFIIEDLKMFMSKYNDFYFDFKVFDENNSPVYFLTHEPKKNIVEYYNDSQNDFSQSNSANGSGIEETSFKSLIENLANISDAEYTYVLNTINQLRTKNAQKIEMLNFIVENIKYVNFDVLSNIYDIINTEFEKNLGRTNE